MPKRKGDAQVTVNDSKGAAESNPQGSGTGGGGEAASSPSSDAASGDNQAPLIPDKGELKYPNLGSYLDELAASAEAGEITAGQVAGRAAMHSGASVAVTICLSGGVDGAATFLEENGGDPRNAGEGYIEAHAPVTQLGTASEQPGVLRVRESVRGMTGGLEGVSGVLLES